LLKNAGSTIKNLGKDNIKSAAFISIGIHSPSNTLQVEEQTTSTRLAMRYCNEILRQLQHLAAYREIHSDAEVFKAVS
jgi:hypothetical protein